MGEEYYTDEKELANETNSPTPPSMKEKASGNSVNHKVHSPIIVENIIKSLSAVLKRNACGM